MQSTCPHVQSLNAALYSVKVDEESVGESLSISDENMLNLAVLARYARRSAERVHFFIAARAQRYRIRENE